MVNVNSQSCNAPLPTRSPDPMSREAVIYSGASQLVLPNDQNLNEWLSDIQFKLILEIVSMIRVLVVRSAAQYPWSTKDRSTVKLT